MKSLKNHHFSNYIYSLLISTYNDYLSNIKKENILSEESKVKDGLNNKNNKISLKSNNPKGIKEYSPSKFKSPKLIDYHYKYKAPQFNKFNIIKRTLDAQNSKNDEEKINNNSLNLFTHRTKKNKNDNNINEHEYKAKYDPIKVSNNFLKFNASKEYSKLSQKLDKNNKKEVSKNINNTNGKIKLSKNNIKQGIIEGYFGRKINTDIPFLFDISSTFYNNYANKSEKVRHEAVLNELNKLKAFLNNDPKNKINIFKNFLVKFNYKNIANLSNQEILSMCDFLCINDNDILFHLIKPYFKSKDIITDLIDNLVFIIKDKQEFNLGLNSNDKHDSREIFNLNDGPLLEIKINKNFKNKNKESKKNLIKNKKMSKTDNYFYNKMKRETYQSPFFMPFKSHRLNSNNNLKKNFVDLSNTNSLLKLLSYQNKVQKPNKCYSLDNDLLINEISKEIRELKNNFDKLISNNQIKSDRNYYQIYKKGNSYSSKISYMKNMNSQANNDTKDIFNKTSIQFKTNKNKKEKISLTKPNINILSLNNKNFEKLKNQINQLSNQKIPKKKIDKNMEKKLSEINERMYYKAINYEFGYKQIKDLYKITEVAALNFAKKKKIDKLSLNLLK